MDGSADSFDPPGRMSAGMSCEVLVTFKPMVSHRAPVFAVSSKNVQPHPDMLGGITRWLSSSLASGCGTSCSHALGAQCGVEPVSTDPAHVRPLLRCILGTPSLGPTWRVAGRPRLLNWTLQMFMAVRVVLFFR